MSSRLRSIVVGVGGVSLCLSCDGVIGVQREYRLY